MSLMIPNNTLMPRCRVSVTVYPGLQPTEDSVVCVFCAGPGLGARCSPAGTRLCWGHGCRPAAPAVLGWSPVAELMLEPRPPSPSARGTGSVLAVPKSTRSLSGLSPCVCN